MATAPAFSLGQHVADLTDPRDEPAGRHLLLDIIGITVGAVLAGAESWLAVAASGRAKQAWLAQFLRLPNGIPSPDTFRRDFGLLDPEALPRWFAAWATALADAGLGIGPTIPIDGTTLRRSGRWGPGLAPRHRVSAGAGAHPVRSGQAVDAKSQEIPAIPRLGELLDRSGARVTINAMGCPNEIAARGEDSSLAVQANPPHLVQDIPDCFPAALESDFGDGSSSGTRTEELNRGREEIREGPGINRPTGWRDAGLGKGRMTIRPPQGLRDLPPFLARDRRRCRPISGRKSCSTASARRPKGYRLGKSPA